MPRTSKELEEKNPWRNLLSYCTYNGIKISSLNLGFEFLKP